MNYITLLPNSIIINLITYSLITNPKNYTSFIKFNNKFYSNQIIN